MGGLMSEFESGTRAGAPLGNQNAQKEKTKSARISMALLPETKLLLKEKADRFQMNLTDFLIESGLNRREKNV